MEHGDTETRSERAVSKPALQSYHVSKRWISTDTLLERGLLPEFVIRAGIRRLLRQRLQKERQLQRVDRFIEEMKQSPIALQTHSPNEQHYEVPTRFFRIVLGKHMKYSSAYWHNGQSRLDTAESDMLELTCERAELHDGQQVLEPGCGWGSSSLFIAERYPQSQIVSISNSRTQKQFIDSEIQRRRLANLQVITADMNTFDTNQTFDRVVTVEMFEHMRNYQKLLEKIAGFLNAKGKLFIHIFTHREFAYPFEVQNESDWMAKYFFSGGMMPSDRLLYSFTDHFEIEQHWQVNGLHYQKTAEAWLRNMDSHKTEILNVFSEFYGKEEAQKWWTYWRVFFMSCEELWGYNGGNEWLVSHYRLRKL